MGPSALQHNPAQLGGFKRNQFSLTLFPQMSGIENGYIFNLTGQGAFVLPIGGLGVSLSGHYVSAAIHGIDSTVYSEMRFDSAYGISFGRFSAGGGLMLLKWKTGGEPSLSGESRTAFDLILGSTVRLYDDLHMSLVIGNLIGRDMAPAAFSERDPVSRYVRLGSGYLNDILMVQADIEYSFFDHAIDFRFGAKGFFLQKGMAVAMGMEFLDGGRGIKPSFGLEGRFRSMRVAYTFAYPVFAGGAGDHLFTVTVLGKVK